MLRRKVEELESVEVMMKRKVTELQEKLTTKSNSSTKRELLQETEPTKSNNIYDRKIKVTNSKSCNIIYVVLLTNQT